jgi:hypothetical protein
MAKYSITNDNKATIVSLLDKAPKIPYWRLAAQMGIHENTLAKYMRMPNDEQAAQIMTAIKEIRASEN